ncbi:MAG: glycosyltransferase [Eubacteriales bacterium]|nr:glycosyltransferase [Eubacteriales bacterium]
MQELPLISVIVPVYGVEKYLDKCLGSITGQTYRNLEIILIDDGSPDGSGVICDAWAAKDSRIKVIHKENGGAGAARNAGLDIARGERIAFVDSDDYIAPDMYRHLSELLDGGADIAECGFISVSGDQAEFGRESSFVTVYTSQDAMREHIRDTVFRQLIWNKLYRREVIKGIRFPEGTKIDDEFFTYQALGNAETLALSGQICYAYRQQLGSVMHQLDPFKRLDGILAKQQRLAYLQAHMPELVDEAKLDLFFTCLYAMQGCLRSLSGDEMEKARRILYDALEDTKPLPSGNMLSGKKHLLLRLARTSFEGTCRMLNFLTDIHVLS